ncbi:hypothetical protein CHUAL_013064 [Chamberlinius hualienensis]
MDLSLTNANTTITTEKTSMKSSEYRKVIKPLLERRRRARINSCLDELKALIMESTENENADASKLEKADILELTVQHLRNLRRGAHQPNGINHIVPTDDKFRAGFTECAQEVSAFLTTVSGVDHNSRCRLLSHLSQHISRIPPSNLHPPMMSATVIDNSHPTPPPSPTSSSHSAEYSPITPVDSPNYVNYQTSNETAMYVWPRHQRCSPAVPSYHPYARTIEISPLGKPWRPW